jgi:hypothetical protein
MANRYMKKCSTSLATKEIWIKTKVRFHLTPVRIDIFKSKNNHKCWQGCSETGTIRHCQCECKLVQPLWKAVCRFLRKLKIELPYDQWYCSWASTQRNISQDTIETPVHQGHHSTIHNSQAMETTQMPYNWFMGQENEVYIHNGVLLSYKE